MHIKHPDVLFGISITIKYSTIFLQNQNKTLFQFQFTGKQSVEKGFIAEKVLNKAISV